jgi:hypothetical protein
VDSRKWRDGEMECKEVEYGEMDCAEMDGGQVVMWNLEMCISGWWKVERGRCRMSTPG